MLPLRSQLRHLSCSLRLLPAVAATCLCLVAFAAGGFYSSSGHGDPQTGVNRMPALYGRGECGHCHETHALQDGDTTLYPYTLFAREENVCWACHTGTVSHAADARSPFSTSPVNTATDFYQHPVSNLYGGQTPSAHRAVESSPSAFAGGNRHVECADCHDPHAATNNGSAGNSTHVEAGLNGNRLSPALLGATGITVSAWQGAGQPFSSAAYSLQRLTSTSSNYEWQICFKCHSTYTTLPTFAALGSGNFAISKLTGISAFQVKEFQDVGQAFNPQNLSFHPVADVGRNSSIPAGSFVSPWATTARMYCADCHTRQTSGSGGTGAHGSTNMHLLERPAYLQENSHYFDSSWGTSLGMDPNDLCFKCHRWQTYVQKSGTIGADPITATNFRDGASTNLHQLHLGATGTTTCYTCHDMHGTNKQHLINFNAAVVTPSGDSQSAYTHSGTGGSCNLTCHTRGHNGTSYAYQ